MGRRRLSIVGSPVASSSRVSLLPENDDEMERQVARKRGPGNHLDQENLDPSETTPSKHFKSPFRAAGSRKSFGANVTVSKLTPSKVTDLYGNCIKLANENVRYVHSPFYLASHPKYPLQKINQKNAFHLNLIDHLSDVFRQQENDGNGNPNFIAASQTLDASVIIYSSRVDCVHADAFRVMGGFSRGIVEQEEGEEGEEEGVEGAENKLK